MVAWLVTWVCIGDHGKAVQPIAAIINYRIPATKVKEIVELIYVNTYFNLAERLAYVKNRKNTP